MLISISGSQGLGKSVLIEALRTRYNIEAITRKTSRSILSDWGVTLSQVNNDRPLTMKFQDEIIKRKLADEQAAIIDPDRFYVTERSYADLFTYAVASLGKDNECSDWLDAYYETCQAYQIGYHKIIYLSNKGRFPGPIQNDGVRAINQHYSRMIDRTMEAVTHEMAGETTQWVVTLEMGDLDGRCAAIESALGLIRPSGQ